MYVGRWVGGCGYEYGWVGGWVGVNVGWMKKVRTGACVVNG